MRISNVIAKKVLSIYNCTCVATVFKILTDDKAQRVKGVMVFDHDENEHYIKFEDIFSIGDVVIVKNLSKLNDFIYEDIGVIGKEVYSSDGKYLGQTNDIEFDEKGKITTIFTDKTELNDFEVLKINEVILVKGEKEVKMQTLKPKMLIPVAKENVTVKIMEAKVNIVPQKISANANLVLGRKAKTNIFGMNNELIVKKDHTITEKTLYEAKKHNKINNLFLNSY